MTPSQPMPKRSRARWALIAAGVLLTGAFTVANRQSLPLPALSASRDAAQDCSAYFAAGNYVRAAMNCVVASENGDAEAQTALAWMYRYGQGMPKNRAEELRWSKAAGDPPSSRVTEPAATAR